MKQSLFILTTILILLSLCTKSKTSSQENKIATVTKNKIDTNSLNNSVTNNIPQENKYFPFSAIKVAVGGKHSLIVDSDSTVWVSGCNEYGQLGIGDTVSNIVHFRKIMDGACDVAAGKNHSLILKKDSTLWATGWNEYGQLGTGDNNDRHGFEMVLSKVLAIAAGNRMTFALRTDSILWATGGNGYGDNPKYDDYDNKERTLFRRDLENVRSIATSWDAQGTFQGFSLAIKNDGTVWGFGGDGWGVFGRGISELGSWSELQHM